MADTGIGASVRRKEDLRFLTGRGRFTDDINRQGQRYAYILRSPHAHAKITSIDISKAAAADGVIAVFTGQDMADAGVGGIPCAWLVTSADGEPMKEPGHPALAVDTVRHVGDQVAVVIAESYRQARDAADHIVVGYQELPAVVSMPEGIKDGATQIWDEAPNNICFDWELGDSEATQAAMSNAAHVAELDLVNNRLIPNALEPRCYIGDYDQANDEYTLYTSTQNPHVIRLLMAAFVLSLPEHKLRVVGPDVGGGFGSKICHYAEEAIVTWCAGQLGEPIKWTAERSESFQTDAHGRDHVTRVRLALDAEGNFLGLEVKTLANMGAYLSTLAPCIPTWLHGILLAGCYTTPAIHVNVKAVFTNTTPVDAYRGAGRPEATYLIERIVDVAADEMGLDPAEIRRKNFIQPEAFPYQTPVALQYDIGDYDKTLDSALKASDYAGFEARRAESAGRGKYRGIGLSTYIEACGVAPSAVVGSLGARCGLYESAQVRVHPTGSVTVFTGSHSHGQGHETTFAQIVSDTLGVSIENVDIVHGDTDKVSFGMGTYGSRSLAVGGAAMMSAMHKVLDKGKKIAAHMMEASVADIEFADGKYTVKGTDKELAFGDVAFAAYVPHNYPIEDVEPGLDETAFYDPKNFTYPAGCHIAEVEIDPETGVIELMNFVASDDVGRVINPMIVEGQVHGGVAQGIGQALLEGCVYDQDNGQLLTGSFMDYCMPRATDMAQTMSADTSVTECTHNELGVKGCGEVGAIGSPPAVINAIVDALSELKVKHVEMPATAHRIWQTIRDARNNAA